MQTAVRRADERVPIKVVVDLASLDVRTPAQEGVTENISVRGARVVTSKPLRPNDGLKVRSLLGNFRSRARVVYCQSLKNGSYAVGLQLFAAAGYWKSPS
jgi:PilZ domain-containing protein